MRMAGALIAAAAFVGVVAEAASAAAVAVLTRAEPGLSSAGTAIWHCTCVAENRERTVVFIRPCPASISVE